MLYGLESTSTGAGGPAAPRVRFDVPPGGDRCMIPPDPHCGLPHGKRLAGPCVIIHGGTTTVAPGGFAGTVDAFGNLHLARGA